MASALTRLLNYASDFRTSIRRATALSIANKVFDVFPEILIGIAVDVVVARDKSFLASLGITDGMNQIIFLAVRFRVCIFKL